MLGNPETGFPHPRVQAELTSCRGLVKRRTSPSSASQVKRRRRMREFNPTCPPGAMTSTKKAATLNGGGVSDQLADDEQGCRRMSFTYPEGIR